MAPKKIIIDTDPVRFSISKRSALSSQMIAKTDLGNRRYPRSFAGLFPEGRGR